MRNKNFIFGEKRRIFGANFGAPSTSEMDSIGGENVERDGPLQFFEQGDNYSHNMGVKILQRAETFTSKIDEIFNADLASANGPLGQGRINNIRAEFTTEYLEGVNSLVKYYQKKLRENYNNGKFNTKEESEKLTIALKADIQNWKDSLVAEDKTGKVADAYVEKKERDTQAVQRKTEQKKRKKNRNTDFDEYNDLKERSESERYDVGTIVPATDVEARAAMDKFLENPKAREHPKRITDIYENPKAYDDLVKEVIGSFSLSEKEEKNLSDFLMKKENYGPRFYGLVVREANAAVDDWAITRLFKRCKKPFKELLEHEAAEFLRIKKLKYLKDKYPERFTRTRSASPSISARQKQKPFNKCSPAEKRQRIKQLMGINHQDWSTVIAQAEQVDDSLAQMGVATNFNERLATELGKGNIEFNPPIAFGVQKLSNLNDVVNLFDKMSNPSAEEIAKTNAFMVGKLGVSEDHSDAKELRFMITFANDISGDPGNLQFTDVITGEGQTEDAFAEKIKANILQKNKKGEVEMKKEIKESSAFAEKYMQENIPKMKEAFSALQNGGELPKGMDMSDMGEMIKWFIEMLRELFAGNTDVLDDWEVKKEAKLLGKHFEAKSGSSGSSGETTVFALKNDTAVDKKTEINGKLEKNQKLRKYLAAELRGEKDIKNIKSAEYNMKKGELTVLEKDSDAKPADPPLTNLPPVSSEKAKSIGDQVIENKKIIAEIDKNSERDLIQSFEDIEGGIPAVKEGGIPAVKEGEDGNNFTQRSAAYLQKQKEYIAANTVDKEGESSKKIIAEKDSVKLTNKPEVVEKPKTLSEKKQFIDSLKDWQEYPYEDDAEKEKYHARQIEISGYGTAYIGVILEGDGDTPRTKEGGIFITVPFGDGNSARHDFYPDQFAEFEEKANRLQNFIDFDPKKNTKEHIALHNENGKIIFGEKYNEEYEFGETDCFITTSKINISEAKTNKINISGLQDFQKYVDNKPYNKNFSGYFEKYREEENLGKIEAKPFEDMKEQLKKKPGFYLVGFRDDKSANGSQHGGILEVTGPPDNKMIYTNAALNVLEHNEKDYLLHQSDSYKRNKILADLTTGSNGEETKQREHIWEQVRAEQGYDRISPKIATRKDADGGTEKYYQDRHYYIQQRINQNFNISFGGEKLPLEKEKLPIGKIISEDFETYLEANPSFAESVYIQGLGDTNKDVTSNSLYVEPEKVWDSFTGVSVQTYPLDVSSIPSVPVATKSISTTSTLTAVNTAPETVELTTFDAVAILEKAEKNGENGIEISLKDGRVLKILHHPRKANDIKYGLYINGDNITSVADDAGLLGAIKQISGANTGGAIEVQGTDFSLEEGVMEQNISSSDPIVEYTEQEIEGMDPYDLVSLSKEIIRKGDTITSIEMGDIESVKSSLNGSILLIWRENCLECEQQKVILNQLVKSGKIPENRVFALEMQDTTAEGSLQKQYPDLYGQMPGITNGHNRPGTPGLFFLKNGTIQGQALNENGTISNISVYAKDHLS